MNRLKAGQTLALPSPAELLATQAAAATTEVKLHASNWQAYRAALAKLDKVSPGLLTKANGRA